MGNNRKHTQITILPWIIIICRTFSDKTDDYVITE